MVRLIVLFAVMLASCAKTGQPLGSYTTAEKMQLNMLIIEKIGENENEPINNLYTRHGRVINASNLFFSLPNIPGGAAVMPGRESGIRDRAKRAN
jgi:hypothetical protein